MTACSSFAGRLRNELWTIIMSLPPTPLTPESYNPPSQLSTPSSDDSSIIELSFDYQFDDAGNYVRVSKPRNSFSNRSESTSSPPTPQDPITRAKSAVVSAPGTSSPVLVNARNSLTRSESYPTVGVPEQRPQSVHVPSTTAPRNFQRVVSSSALSSTASLRTGAPLSNGVRGTGTVAAAGRKLAARLLGPQRVTMEQQREMNDKIRAEDDEVVRREREEKENITEAVEHEGEQNLHPHSHAKQQHRPSTLSPRLASRSASISHVPAEHNPAVRITSNLPSRASSFSATTAAPTTTTTTSARQILPGPSRAGRILMGTKYASSSAATAPSAAAPPPGPSSAPASGGAGLGLNGGFDKISEVDDAFDDADGAVMDGVLDFYGPDELDAGMCFIIH